ncbi:fimbrillin family protein [Parabacteroides faecis]|uniref:fimbrillin family protein n=1 Tax=Parabacteroides faecis TaxID=1217282 RepID=UPI002164A1FB|nr:fimbrillin family protein [Parabacteroides faecis]MCS2893547.1 fimbrillin family protein [Parabacteroides faecis]UVQ47857.1 fimbrillin family protein [Parabacteroides faecis]
MIIQKLHGHNNIPGYPVRKGCKILPCLLLVGILLGGCTRESACEEPDTDRVMCLNFIADIYGSAKTRTPIIGGSFPASVSGTIHNIGMFMMCSDEMTPYETGSDNLTAELTASNGYVDTWRYRYRDGNVWKSNLTMKPGETVKLWAYYPRSAVATVDCVPFDLTEIDQQNNQSDLLWCATQTLTVANADVSKSISLHFRHAYALLEFLIKKKTADPAIVTHIEVTNKSGNWIANKGNMNPLTGIISGATTGTVGVNCLAALATDGYTTIRVMVPPFSGIYADDEIEILFHVEGNSALLSFPVKRSYLSSVGNEYGLAAGLKYSYMLLYSLHDGSLILLPWNDGSADGDLGGKPTDGTVNISPWTENNIVDENVGEKPLD